ncbi:MAG: PAS domain S-box protein, partial [bacterium]
TDGPPDYCPRARVLATGEDTRHEFYEPALEAFLDVTHSPLKDADGVVAGTVVVASDVTARKRAEEEIKKRLEFEKVVATISSRFAAAAVVDEAVQASLADMARFSGAGRVYLFLLRDDGATMDNTHEWCAEGVEPQIENLQGIPADTTPWWTAKLRADEVIHVVDVSKLPAKAKAEREFLEAQNIKSLLVLPLKVGGELAGFVGFDNVEEAGEWPTEDLALLRVFAEDLGTALERKRAEEALRASEENYRHLFENANDAVFVFRLGEDGKPTTFVDVNDVACTRLGYTKEELLELTPADLAPPESAPLVSERLAMVREKKHALFEWTHLTKDGKHLPVEISTHLFELKGQPTILSIIRDITARKRAERELKRRSEEISGVNEVAIELAAAASGAEMFAIICERLKDLTGAFTTISTRYDESTDELVLNYVAAENKVIKKANQLIGVDIYKLRFHPGRYTPEEMASERVFVSDGIPEQAYKVIPKAVCKTIEKAFNFGEIYDLALQYGGELLGTAEVVMLKGAPSLSVDTLEAFAHAAAAALRRKRAEEALARRGEEITAVNELAIELATAASATEMFARICTKLKDVTGALATITTSYDETRDELALNYIVAETKVIKKGNKILGIDATKMKFPAERYEPEEMASDRVVISDGIPERAYKTISKTVCKVIEKTFNLGEIYSLLLHHAGKMMGTAEVVMPKGSLPLSVDTLEAFAHVAAAALQRKRAEEALAGRAEDMRALNDLAVELAAAPSAEAICEIAGERLREISGAFAVVLTEYDSAAKELIIDYISAPADFFKKVRKLIPGPINNIRTPIDDETYEEIISRRVKRHEGLHELTLGAVPKPLAAALEKALGLGEIVVAGLQYAGALLGSGAVLMPKGRPAPSEEILENFANVTAAALGRRRAEETVRQRSYDLGERVKELNCLYTISRLVDDPDNTLEDIIQGTVDVIPASWQYPEATCARVVIDGRGEFSTKRCRPADAVARQTADINGGGKRAGTVEVGYCEEKPERDEGPFLKEERDLLNAIAERLGKAVEAKNAEAAFKESEERYRGLVEGAHDMVQSVGPDGRFFFVNRAWLETMAYAEEDLANLTLFDVIHPDHISACRDLFRRVFAGESLAGIEAAFITKDGREVLVEGNAGPRFVDGKVVGTQGFFRDVTSRARAEGKIKRRLEFEEVVAVVSSRFASGVEFDRAVTVSLADMGRFTAAGRAYLFLLRDDGAAIDNTHEWCAKGVEPQIENLQGLPAEAVPWWMAKLRADEVIHVVDVSKLPAEAKAERELLEAQEIKSLLVLPLHVGGELAGFVGFDNVEEAGKWEPEDLALLRVFAEVLGTSLERERAEKALQEAHAQLEKRVEERTAELDAANLDLRREVGERTRAEEALRESEEKYRNIFEHSPAGIVIHQNGKILFVSPAMFQMVGYESADEVVGRPVLEFIPPDRHKQHKEEVEIVMARGGELGQPTEQVLIRKDGSLLDVTSVGQAITYDGAPALQAFVVNDAEPKRAREALRDAHGQLEKRVEERTAEIKNANFKLLRQIEERKRAEEALRKSEREKAAVLENMPEQVVFRDREMTTIWGNKAAADWFGLTPRELVGRRCYEARYGRKEPCEDCDVAKSMDTGEPGEHETTSPDGRVWSNRYSPVRDEAGGIIGVVETTLDITERKRAEEELTKYQNLVEERVETGTNESKKKGRSRGR